MDRQFGIKFLPRNFLLIILGFYFFAENRPISADDGVVRYRDEHGNYYYVSNLSKVPEKYRQSVDKNHKLPNITRGAPVAHSQPNKNWSDSKPAPAVVMIYVTSWCGYCQALEKFLKNSDVSFKKFDVENDPIGKKRYLELGGGGVPIVQIGSEVLRGFDPAELKARLKIR